MYISNIFLKKFNFLAGDFLAVQLGLGTSTWWSDKYLFT